MRDHRLWEILYCYVDIIFNVLVTSERETNKETNFMIIKLQSDVRFDFTHRKFKVVSLE